MRDEMRSFLEEGVKQYVQAKATVAAFEQAMAKSLEATVQGREQWSPLRNKQIGRAAPGGKSGGYGYYIAISVTGQSPRREETEIDCGLWWNCDAPEVTEPIIYASYYGTPKRVAGFHWREKQGIRSFSRWGRTFLYIPMGMSAHFEEPINRLLDALLKQLK